MMNMTSQSYLEGRRRKVLHEAARLFMEKGYVRCSIREIAMAADVNVSALIRIFGSKENIIAELVGYVLESEFEFTEELLKGVTEDKLLFYATEAVLQLHMAEAAENIRELYGVSYSLPNTSAVIQRKMTHKLENIFKEYLPELETKDFYELEIASGGIMRGFMTIPCDMYFTMERKVARFLETAFLVYRIPEEKIQEAIDFVGRFDFPKLAQQALGEILYYLDSKA